MEAITSQFSEIRRLNKRQFLFQILNFLSVVASALMIWKGMMVVTGSDSPIVVVLSGSMLPAFDRGDLLFLTKYDDPIRVGEIVVYNIKGREIPIVHRVMKVHDGVNNTQLFLTKGDNNRDNDRNGGLYSPDHLWLTPEDIVGRVQAWIPKVGMMTILMNDYPKFQFVLLSGLALYVLTNRE